MRLSHFPRVPWFEFDPARVYDVAQRSDKPTGFWVSVDGPDDWPTWCLGEDWGVESLTRRHRVTLAASANILVIDDGSDLERFHYRWAIPGEWRGVDWAGLARLYDGIIIAPYQWQHRYSETARWYYGWDCASGCIWNLDAIASVLPDPPRQLLTSAENDVARTVDAIIRVGRTDDEAAHANEDVLLARVAHQFAPPRIRAHLDRLATADFARYCS